VLIGVLAVVSAAYLAAVFLSADAVRGGSSSLERRFRLRALISGALSGAIALGGVFVLHSDAHRLYHRLVGMPGLPALIVSALCGVAAFALVWLRRYEPARYLAAGAVVAIIVGWALAQQPVLLRGLTIRQAAAPHDTLVLVVIAVLGGGAILFPSLALLFRLTLGGHLAHGGDDAPRAAPVVTEIRRSLSTGLLTRCAGACLLGGLGFLTIADAGWAHLIGVLCLFGFVIMGVAAVGPAALAASSD
jgi:cytochrome bd ubiquinol oxidase subunit II